MNGVLVDTSVWVDRFRRRNVTLIALMDRDLVLTHPFVLGEIACGTPPNRAQTLKDLNSFQQTRQASLHEMMDFIEREKLFGLGCGLVDMLLLASTMITPSIALWTLDKRLHALAKKFKVEYRLPSADVHS